MRRIESAPPPASHRTYRALNAAFAELSSDPAIRRALWNEQGGRCAYCERRLRNPGHPDHRTRIEHFHPQSAPAWSADCAICSGAEDNGDAPTQWRNLLLCCDGNEHSHREFTCDKSKADTDICGRFRNPKTWTRGQVAVVDRGGRARPGAGLPAGAPAVVDHVLNLNAEHLVGARKSLIAAYQRKLGRKGLTAAQREQCAARLRREASTAEYGSTLLMLADRLLCKASS